MESLEIAPPFSQVMVGDEKAREALAPTKSPVTRGRFGVVITTLMWQDGPTRFDIGVDEHAVVPPELSLAFDGAVDVPSRVVCLTDPEWRTYWRREIRATTARIRVWINHPSEPDHVVIELIRGPV